MKPIICNETNELVISFLSAFQLQDDNREQCITLEEILPSEPIQPISYDALLILLGKTIKTQFKKKR